MQDFAMTLKIPSNEHAEEIRSAVKTKYLKVAAGPKGFFAYPVGKESALNLGYDPLWFKDLDAALIERFVGVGNPFKIRTPKPGNQVLDAGCGCGLDTFIAGAMAGLTGRAIGIDLTKEMLAAPLVAAETFRAGNVEFLEGSIEKLPFEDGFFDLAISNGVLNLIPDKQAAFAELARVLRLNGALVAADLLVIETIPPEALANTDAWST
jgi:arsenite methyltransferase